MSYEPQPLTRKELAEFLPSQRAIRAFEILLKMLPNLDGVELAAGDARAMSEEALAAIARLSAAIEGLASLEIIATQEIVDVDDDLSPREAFSVDEMTIDPRQEIGTLGQQQSDNVDVTGGGITASITDDTTNLIASSVTLVDGSGANTATLTNSPASGDPTKWVAFDDNGTTRYIPAW